MLRGMRIELGTVKLCRKKRELGNWKAAAQDMLSFHAACLLRELTSRGCVSATDLRVCHVERWPDSTFLHFLSSLVELVNKGYATVECEWLDSPKN